MWDAWLQVHKSVLDHKKTMALAEALDLPDLYAAAHMIALWLWGLDNAPDGVLPSSTRTIAKAARWEGDPRQFADAIVHAGYIDRDEGGLLHIHDWDDTTGRLMDQREKQARKMRDARKRWKQQRDEPEEGERYGNDTGSVMGNVTTQKSNVTPLDIASFDDEGAYTHEQKLQERAAVPSVTPNVTDNVTVTLQVKRREEKSREEEEINLDQQAFNLKEGDGQLQATCPHPPPFRRAQSKRRQHHIRSTSRSRMR